MKRIVTYSLRQEEANSDAYYRVITEFSQRWVESARAAVGAEVAGFHAWRVATGKSPDRSFSECAFELLVLGVMLREHGLQAAQTPAWVLRWLKTLIAFQGKHSRAEKAIKTVRGWSVALARPFWNRKNKQSNQTRKVFENLSGCNGTQKELEPDMRHPVELRQIELLLDWMRALDYGGQVERLAEWQSYLETLGPGRAVETIDRCLNLASLFAQESIGVLGAYTQGVAKFLQEEAPRHAWQYDALFVSRGQVEYHLGMLGTELLSGAYLERFLETQRKVVILPPCMRGQPEVECKAVHTPLGDRCRYCTPGCPVQAVAKLGEDQGFEVYMMPDELRKFRSGSPQGKNTFGVVGVSCALTNWSGGWDLDKEGIPGQGLLLDFVGCSYHWDKKGIPTEVNLQKLSELIAAKIG